MLCLLLPGVPGGTHLNLLSGKKWPIFAEFVPLVAALSQSLEFVSYRRWNCRIGPPIKIVWAWLKVNALNFFQVQKQSSLSRGPISSFISCSFTNNTGLALPYNVVGHRLKSFAKIDFRSRTFFFKLLCFWEICGFGLGPEKLPIPGTMDPQLGRRRKKEFIKCD